MTGLNTNLNTSPYYDDFDEEKNFHRILFKPGVAVQARELTQVQTYLQNQVERHGDHIFRNGSIVIGCEFQYDSQVSFVKVRDKDSNNVLIDTSAFTNNIIVGESSGVQARVIDNVSGSEAAQPNYNTLYVKYTNSGSNNTTQEFVVGEKLALVSDATTTANAVTSNATGFGSRFSVASGLIYQKGNFVRVAEQSIILDKYETAPSYSVGFKTVETIIDSDADSSLLDNAQGAPNFNAPGADRIKLTPTLAKRATTDTSNTNPFFAIIEFIDGSVLYAKEPAQYEDLGKFFAKRTFEESGSYTVAPFNIQVREHLKDSTNLGRFSGSQGGDSNKLAVGIEPGTAYIGGFRTELLSTAYVDVDKAVDVAEAEAQTLATNFGNYVLCDQVVGLWDFQGLRSISLRDVAANSIANSTYGDGSATGAEIGTADLRGITYDTGLPGDTGQYKIHIFNIQMNTDENFSGVRSLYINNSGTLPDSFADVVLESSKAVLKESNFNTMVYSFGQGAISTLRDLLNNNDTQFVYRTEKTVTLSTAGAATFSPNTAHAGGTETFPYSLGALNNTQEREWVIVPRAEGTTADLAGTVTFTGGSNTVTGSATAFNTEYNVGEYIELSNTTPSVIGTFRIHAIGGATNMTIIGDPAADADGAGGGGGTHRKKFPKGAPIQMGVTGSQGDRTITINSGTSATVDINEDLTGTLASSLYFNLKRDDATQSEKLSRETRYVKIDLNTHSDGVTGPWGLGISDVYEILAIYKGATYDVLNPDVKDDFIFDNGQRDSFYDHSRLVQKIGSPTLTASEKLLVELNHFDHSETAGISFFSIDSYPIDDTSSANNTAIQTEEIPVFTSPSTGRSYDLRDSVDFRPRRTDTSTSATSVGTATENPANSATYDIDSDGAYVPAPNENFQADLQYYLRRKDKIVMNPTGGIEVIKGIPSAFPRTPQDKTDTMTIGVLDIPPFPSLAPNIAVSSNRPDYGVKQTMIDNRRFTMRDIGAIEKRVSTLEYYTSLNLLEQAAKQQSIIDQNGSERFKNGILVEPFTGHNIGDVNDSTYNIAIDRNDGKARPPFSTHSVSLEFNTGSTNVARSANDSTLTVTSNTNAYDEGEQVYVGGSLPTSTARGIVHQVFANSSTTKLYVKNVQGAFGVSDVLKRETTGTATVSIVANPVDGDIISLPWEHVIYGKQSFASKVRNPVQELVFNWIGEITLDPEFDFWRDNVERPTVQVDWNNNFDNFRSAPAPWETQWQNWVGDGSTGTAGLPTDFATTDLNNRVTRDNLTQNRQFDIDQFSNDIRTGTRVTNLPTASTGSIGPFLTDAAIVPWMRSRLIRFHGFRMRPGTRLYPYFDGERVDSYCTPTDSAYGNTAGEGSSLVSDSSGNAYGVFRLPNDNTLRFLVGTKPFQLIDIANTAVEGSSITTSATSSYTASGIQTTQRRIVSTPSPRPTPQIQPVTPTIPPEIPQVVTVSPVREVVRPIINNTPPPSTAIPDITIPDILANIRSLIDISNIGARIWGGDPLAQSFVIADDDGAPGLYVSKIEIFFSQKSDDFPITLQIREMENGNPTPRVLSFGSKTVQPGDVNVSEDGSAATPFLFDSPVFLSNQREYAFVIIPAGNNPDYRVWTAELGGTDVATGAIVAKQPTNGVMFTSANDRTWTEYQSEDIKYTLYRCAFDNGITGTLLINNEETDFITLRNVTGTFEIGEKVTSGSKSGFVDRWSSIDKVLYIKRSTGDFTTNNVILGSVSSANGTLTTVDDADQNVLATRIASINPTGTNIAWKAKTTSASYVIGSTFVSIDDNIDNIFTDAPKLVAARTNEVGSMSSAHSLQIQGTMTTNTSKLSPLVDISMMNAIVVGNKINNLNTGEIGSQGSAEARYITKRVILNQDSEDVKVYISAYKPASTDIDIYVKFHNAEDNEIFDDKSYTLLNQITPANTISDSVQTNDVKEFEYGLPSANGSTQGAWKNSGNSDIVRYTNSGGAVFDGFRTFSAKIVLRSTGSEIVPTVSDLRIIALQV